MSKIPLFPLHAVLFPGGTLPLRIFEPRYLDMVSSCLKAGTGFGVCLIQSGEEIGSAAASVEVGTMAAIIDWNMRDDGLLGIVISGGQRFRVLEREVLPNQLVMADIEWLPNETDQPVLLHYLPLIKMLKQFLQSLGRKVSEVDSQAESATWISCRLAEILPLSLAKKQELLQLSDPIERLSKLKQAIDEMNCHS